LAALKALTSMNTAHATIRKLITALMNRPTLIDTAPAALAASSEAYGPAGSRLEVRKMFEKSMRRAAGRSAASGHP